MALLSATFDQVETKQGYNQAWPVYPRQGSLLSLQPENDLQQGLTDRHPLLVKEAEAFVDLAITVQAPADRCACDQLVLLQAKVFLPEQ